MSIAQLRAFSPHYFVVALLLSIVAVTAFSLTQAEAAAGDTSIAVGAAAITPSQSTIITTTADAVPANTSEAGVVTITGGSLLAKASGVVIVTQTWTNLTGSAAAVVEDPLAFFPNDFVGTVTTAANDTSSATQPGTNGTATILVVGAPVFTMNLQVTGGDPNLLAPIGSITTNLLANVDYQQDADLYVSISDVNGTAYPNAVTVTLTIDNTNLAALGTAGLAFTATQPTANDDTSLGGTGARDGVAAFIDAGRDEGITAKLLGARGTVTVTATIPEGSKSLAIPVTGPVASITTTLFDVANIDTDNSNALTVVTYAAAAPNALGMVAPTFGAPDVINNTTLAVQVTALDADGTIVNVLPAAAAPTIVDTNTTAALRLVTGGTAMGDFGTAGSQGVATSVGAGKAFGLLVGGGTAAQGLHTVRGSFTPTGLVALTADATVRQGGAPADIAFTVAPAQTAHTLNSDQLGVITATVTSSDGGIVGDRTLVTVVAPVAFGVAYQGANPAGTVNGVATITTLPLSVAANLTFTMTSGTIVKTFQVVFGANASTLPSAVAVTSALTELALGGATTVSAAVTLTSGAVGAGITGIWSEGTSVASVPSNVTTTDAAGVASITFTGDEAGVRTVTFTVVNLVGGVVVETAIKGSVDITVTATAPVSGVSGLTSETGFSAYIGGADSTAAELFAALSHASILWLWDGSQWIFYATLSGGTELPGSENFNVTLGSILFIG